MSKEYVVPKQPFCNKLEKIWHKIWHKLEKNEVVRKLSGEEPLQ